MRWLVWFRSDLRVHDNPALHHACAHAERGVIAVYAICPDQWAEHDWGAPRIDFILRNLAVLKDRLATLNIPLRILTTDRFADLPESLAGLMSTFECDALAFNNELEINEARRDDAVESFLINQGRTAKRFHDQCILAPGTVTTNDGNPYKVYSPFRRRWGDLINDEGLPALCPDPKKQPAFPCESSDLPSRLDSFDDPNPGTETDDLADLWPAGEQAALTRLTRFARHRIDRYHQDRDRPDLDGVSALSPYLAHGVVSIRKCLHAAAEAANGHIDRKPAKGTGPGVWINELVWREFYKHLIVAFPKLCMSRAFRPEYDRIEWSYDEPAFDAWKRGRTGYPIVDAAMRQLNRSGWMHNRLRMIVAMFLTKDLLIDWRWGERYFMNRLLDGDLASNNGGWQWSASTGTDAAPYFRIFNPSSQSRKCDPEGAFIRRFVPELADLDDRDIHEPWTIPALLRSQIDYPERIVDHDQARKKTLKAFEKIKG
ncbi:MAG: deoxyribodipyrimidine photo-lyase [Phycisphaerales bacterium JB037]